MTPTLHLTNWSSGRLHGPGRRFTIMARPRTWEMGEGCVVALKPSGLVIVGLLQRALEDRTDEAAMRAYREAYEAVLSSAVAVLRPRRLTAFGYGTGMGGGLGTEVGDGDTLCCACSVAEARAGRCHRSWAAPFLVRAGWRVVLDGEEVGL